VGYNHALSYRPLTKGMPNTVIAPKIRVFFKEFFITVATTHPTNFFGNWGHDQEATAGDDEDETTSAENEYATRSLTPNRRRASHHSNRGFCGC